MKALQSAVRFCSTRVQDPDLTPAVSGQPDDVPGGCPAQAEAAQEAQSTAGTAAEHPRLLSLHATTRLVFLCFKTKHHSPAFCPGGSLGPAKQPAQIHGLLLSHPSCDTAVGFP